MQLTNCIFALSISAAKAQPRFQKKKHQMEQKLMMEDYVLYEQMVREILMEGNGGDGSAIAAAATGGTTEAQIVGIKHWWTRSAYAYLNTPALSMDGNGRSNKHANAIPYVPQERCTAIFCSSTPRQPNVDALAIF
uniref:Uncharacterized protein n=1 Tax=Zea mays TaxID=4577 RepID=A0A804RLM6_MAIZE